MELRGACVVLGLLLLLNVSVQQKPTKRKPLKKVCLKGIKVLNKCFLVDSAKKSYHAASEDCNSKGGVLVTPVSSSENTQLLDYIQQSLGCEEQVWLGINDMITEGDWVDQTGTKITYKNWAPTRVRGPRIPGGPVAVGDRGAWGARGQPMGIWGAMEPSGPMRCRGLMGPMGPMGPSGPRGPMGPMGPPGPSRPRGPRGPMRHMGPPGHSRPRGPRGPMGPMEPRRLLGHSRGTYDWPVQPNGGTSQNCAVMSTGVSGEWFDENCKEEKASVCQFNII